MSNHRMLKTAVLIFSFILTATLSYEQSEKTDDMKILMLMGEWFGDMYFPLKDRLDELNIKSVRIDVDEKYRECYIKANDVELTNETLISDFKEFSEYDVLMIPSGLQFRKFIENRTVLDFVKTAYESGLIIDN